MPPHYFAETATPLRHGSVRVTSVGGGGGNMGGGGAGGGARLRVGVGGRHEVGIEGSALRIRESAGAAFGSALSSGRVSDSTTFAGKVSWKVAANRWLAFIGGAGAARSGVHDTETHPATYRGVSLATDVAAVVSKTTESGVPFYAGARFSIAVPVAPHGVMTPPPASALSLGAGWAPAVRDDLHVLIELGPTLAIEQLGLGGYVLVGANTTFGE
jgi:hypothetical protein